MANAIVAVFDELGEAQQAQSELLSSGFSDKDVRLSGKDSSFSGLTEKPKGIGAFFRKLLGTEEQSGMYSQAVEHGSYVVTAIAQTDDKIEVATEVFNHHHPIDIDERASQWSAGSEGQTESQTIPVVEEELKVGKREVQRGGVRVFQRVSFKPIEEEIELTEEKVTVERTPANRPLGNDGTEAFKEGSFEMREKAEEAVVSKTAKVVEEVRIGKQVTGRKEKISDTVRRTDVDVQPIEEQTIDAYRSHFEKNYAGTGLRYEDYQPTYEYGSRMAADERYAGRPWSDVEPELRSDWESRNPGSKWDRFKDSIRYGLERLTGKSNR